MKISPVVNTPNSISPASEIAIGGISASKIQRAKAIAAGQEPPAIEQKAQANNSLRSIKMNVNRTVNRDSIFTEPEAETATEEPKAQEETPAPAISDADVQATAPAATQPLSPQLAALARQRRALQVKERELADKEKALGTSAITELEAQIKSQPLSVLRKVIGPDFYSKLTDDILAEQSGSHNFQSLESKVRSLEENLDKKLTQTLSDRDVRQEESVLMHMADELDELVTSSGLEMIKESEGQEEVLRRIYTHWKKTGKLLDLSSEAQKYDDELAEEAAKYAKFKKVQSRLTLASPPLQQQPQSGIRTLTNKDQAKPLMGRRQRAIAAMLGQQKG